MDGQPPPGLGKDAAQELKGYAEEVLNNIGGLRNSRGKEFRLTLGDMEAMAHLGNYYVEKVLAADGGDFSIKEGSPALELGIEPLDV